MAAREGSHPIEWATSAFREAMQQRPGRVTLDAWKDPSGAPFTCYVFPMSVAELDAIQRAREAGGIEPLLETVLQRAKDADGKRIFQRGHKAQLRRETLGNDLADLAHAINTAVPEPATGQGALADAGKP